MNFAPKNGNSNSSSAGKVLAIEVAKDPRVPKIARRNCKYTGPDHVGDYDVRQRKKAQTP